VLTKLRLRWYWPSMERDVRLRVKRCEICQASKHSRLPGEAGRRRLYAGRPWQVVAVDLVRPMPLTPRWNCWILVLTDHFTWWADTLAIPDASAPTVARVLDQNVFCYFGLPEQLHLDQGSQFQSQLLSDLCRLWEVNKSRTTPYHPPRQRSSRAQQPGAGRLPPQPPPRPRSGGMGCGTATGNAGIP